MYMENDNRINISVSSLLVQCPRYIIWHSLNPVEAKSFDMDLGNAVHLTIKRHAENKLYKTNKEILSNTISEIFPNWKKAGAYVQLYTATQIMSQAALDFLHDNIKEASYEIPISFAVDKDITINGIADVVSRNRVVDWKTGKWKDEKHKLQVSLYCYLLNKNNLIDIPCTGSVVYVADAIEQGYPVLVDFDVTKNTIKKVEEYVYSIVKDVKENGAVARRNECKFCPYKKLCY